MAITISGNGITSANIADGTITTDDINASDVTSLKSGRKNLIINGAMQVAQRGTSITGIGSEKYTLDRFVVIGSGADVSVSQESGTSFDKALRVTGASGNTLMYLSHRIEAKNSNFAAGQSVTLSVNIKGSTSKTVTARLAYATATDNFGGTTEIATQSFSVTTTDAKFTHTFTVPSAATTGLEIRFYPSGGLGASETLDFSGLQIELGDTATDFEHRSYGEELALCQRYYHRIDRANYGTNTVLTGINSAAHNIFMVTIPASMRVAPTITKTGTNFTVYSTNSTAVVGTGNPTFSPGAFGFLGGRFLFSKTGDIGHGCWLDIDNADTYFEFDSEL